MTSSDPTSNLEYKIVDGYAPVDPEKIRSLLRSKGISQEKLGTLIHSSRATVYRMLSQEKTLSIHLENVAKVLGAIPSALQPSSDYYELDEPGWEIPPPRGWEIVRFVRRFTKAANGLAYFVAKLESKHVPQKFSRGKFYQLSDVQSMNRKEFVDRLVRHPTVCSMLKGSELVVRNLDVRPFANDSAWWVLDEWIEGLSLNEFMEDSESIAFSDIRWIASSILDGLSDLHRSDVIFRELAPERVYVLSEQSQILLTDFELAKLGDGIPSVSGDWKIPNPYRAPEIGEYSPSVKVDIYSWAAIVAEMFTGDPNADLERLADCVQHEETAKLLVRCRHPKPSARPESLELVRADWNSWTVAQK